MFRRWGLGWAKLAESVVATNSAIKRRSQLLVGLQEVTELLGGQAGQIEDRDLVSASKKLAKLVKTAALWNEPKQEGRAAFPEDVVGHVDSLLDACAKLGVFLCPCGELEGLMPDVPANDKAAFLERALTLLRDLEVRPEMQPFLLVKDVLHWLKQDRRG